MTEFAQEGLPRLDLNSEQLPPSTALKAWSSALPEYEITQPEGADPAAFRIRATGWLLGDIVVTHGEVSAVTLVRSEARARADGGDNVNLVLSRAGTSVGEIGERTVTLAPGQIVSMDYARPSVWRSTDNSFITVSIARMAMLSLLPQLPDFHGRLLGGSPGRLLVDFLVALVRQLPHLTREDSSDVSRATITLVKAAFATLPAQSEPDDGAGLRHRVRRLVNERLMDQKLTVAQIAAELGVSRSSLYASCEALGGISSYIRQRRLEAARALLTNREERRSITELAGAFGFKTASHFSEAFRLAFGETPGSVRRRGTKPSLPTTAGEGEDVVDGFRGWMRRLAAR